MSNEEFHIAATVDAVTKAFVKEQSLSMGPQCLVTLTFQAVRDRGACVLITGPPKQVRKLLELIEEAQERLMCGDYWQQ